MNRKKIFAIFIFLIAGFLVFSQKKLTFGGIEGSLNQKIGAEILKKVYAELGYSLDFKVLPSKRSLVMVNDGKLAGEVQRIDNMNKSYPNLVKVPQPLFYLIANVYTVNKNFKVSGWESLRGYMIGIRNGIKYAEDGTEGMNRTKANGEDNLIQMLLKNRIEIMVANPYITDWYLEDMKITNIKKLQPPIVKRPLFHYLHVDYKHLVDKAAKILKKMEKSGQLKKITNQVLAREFAQ